MKLTQFSISLQHGDEHVPLRWIVVCDLCGADLGGSYEPVVILNLKGNIPASQFEVFKRMWYSQVANGKSMGRPILMNTEMEKIELATSLQQTLHEHAKTCSRDAT